MIKKYFLHILLMVPLLVFSQDGEVDLSFNTPVHLNEPDINGFEDENNIASIFSAKLLTNGKLLVYGKFDKYQGVTVNDIAILNTDGTLDTSFNAGTGIEEHFNTGAQQMMDLQADGKILIAGSFNTFNGSAAHNIVRLNTDGSIDGTFLPALPLNTYLTCIKLQNDGKILCAGSFAEEYEEPKGDIIRLNANGSIDATFTTGTGFTMRLPVADPNPGYVYSIAIQDDNKILAGGYFARYNGVEKFNLVRLNTNGSLDGTFLIGNGASVAETYTEHFGSVNKIVFDPQNSKIYIAGVITAFNGAPSKNVKRLNMDGTTDTTFNFTDDPGYSEENTDRYINVLAVNHEGKIIIGGAFTVGNNRNIAMYLQNGQLDTGFAAQVTGNLENVTTICTSNNVIYALGYFSTVNGYSNNKGSVVKLDSNGQTDISFNPNLGANSVSGECSTAFELADGSIIVTTQYGDFMWNDENYALYNERPATGSIKINADGSIYQADYNNFITSNVAAIYISYSNDGGLILSDPVATSKLSVNGITNPLFRNTRAIIAPYDVNVNVFTHIHAVQPDNKILIAGNFQYADALGGHYRQRIMRVNEDGTLDSSFYTGKGFNGLEISGNGYFGDFTLEVTTLAIQADGKIVAGGHFSDYNDTPVLNIARLNGDGTIDATFNQGTGFNKHVRSIKYLANGKLIVCGDFTEYNGTTVNYMVRLNENGTIDPTFTSPYTSNPEPTHPAHLSNIVVQMDGKYLVNGNLYNTELLNRLNADGTIDGTFNNESIFSGSTYDYTDRITSVTLLRNSKILLTGTFAGINGIRRCGIAVLNNAEITAAVNDAKSNPTKKVSIVPNPATNVFTIQSDNVITKAELFTTDGRRVQLPAMDNNKYDISTLPLGMYLIKMYSGTEVFTSKIIKN